MLLLKWLGGAWIYKQNQNSPIHYSDSKTANVYFPAQYMGALYNLQRDSFALFTKSCVKIDLLLFT